MASGRYGNCVSGYSKCCVETNDGVTSWFREFCDLLTMPAIVVEERVKASVL